MIYLLHYDRAQGKLVMIREFADQERDEASRARIQLEIDLMNHSNGHEIVVLEAASESDLRETHRRYFESLGSLAKPSAAG